MTHRFTISSKDIVLVDPGYSDQRESKIRPALIISKSLFHQNSGFFVCLGITINMKPDPYLIPISSKNVDVILEENSQVMCKRIVTVRQDAIKKKIASVTTEFYSKIINKITNDILDL